jgi:polysaccharide chain length determinant protein (PEP-CTERM system associated)
MVNDLIDRVYDEARSAWRFRWIGLVAAAVLAGLGWMAVLALPDRYEATASVFVDTQTALRPMLEGLAVDQDVNVQLNYVRQALLSGERLERIARTSGVLSAAESDPRRVSAILKDFAPRLKLDVTSANAQDQAKVAGSIYTFEYQDRDRDRGLKVMQTVVDTFVEETLGGKREGTEGAQRFVEDELKDLKARLAASENRIADFRKANLGLMPTEGGDSYSEFQKAVDDARRVENELQVASSRRAELERQLRGDAVVGATSVGGGSSGAGGATDTVTRINQAQARLDELLLRFTDRHPAVVEARATLAELTARRTQEIEQLRRGDASAVASSGVSTNPVYQNIRMQLNQAEVEVASLRGQLSQHRTKANELRSRLDIAPKVEAEYAELTRDYEVLNARYAAMLASYEQGELGERADTAGSVRFEIVQPVESPYEPVFPPRTLLMITALAVAVAGGAALAWALHLLRPVVSSVRSLTEMTELPVLGVVSAAFPHELAARAKAESRRFVLASSALVATFIIMLALNWVGLRLPGVG